MGKSAIVDENKFKKEFSFPIIAKHLSSSIVVLFTSHTSGTVLVGDDEFKAGWHDDTWYNFKEDKNWIVIPELTVKFTSYNEL